MENGINMEGKEIVKNVLNNLNESTNKEIQFSLDFLNTDFQQTKETIINLTKHLDNLEIAYNKVLKEYENRTNIKHG